jgi:Protein of unknown function (DUF2752)
MRLVREAPRADAGGGSHAGTRSAARGGARGGAPGAILAAAMLTGAALSAAWLRLGLPLPACRFREWTGVPCATCGSTRMIEALLHGRILEAAAWNPLVFCGVVLLCSWCALSAARLAFGLPAWRLVVGPWERRALGLLLVAAVAADWIYIVWHGV